MQQCILQKEEEFKQLQECNDLDSFVSASFGHADLSRVNSTLMNKSKGNTRISLGMALTKAIEKENTIEEMKEDLEKVLKKYEELEDE